MNREVLCIRTIDVLTVLFSNRTHPLVFINFRILLFFIHMIRVLIIITVTGVFVLVIQAQELFHSHSTVIVIQ